jgi:hypothetical protein
MFWKYKLKFMENYAEMWTPTNKQTTEAECGVRAAALLFHLAPWLRHLSPPPSCRVLYESAHPVVFIFWGSHRKDFPLLN